jgi:DNA-directed RNA polymerase I subunit RPA2
LIREHSFQYPPTSKAEYPALQLAVQPHIDSFNAITADNLLEIAVRDIGKKTVFDHKGVENGGRGNKLVFWLEEVQLARPTLSSRERTSLNRRLYPAEVVPLRVRSSC